MNSRGLGGASRGLDAGNLLRQTENSGLPCRMPESACLRSFLLRSAIFKIVLFEDRRVWVSEVLKFWVFRAIHIFQIHAHGGPPE